MKTLEELGVSPAPWHIKDGTDVPCMKCEHREVPLVDTYGCFENVNDVYIVAAAPELYEALAALLNCAEREAPFTKESGMSIAMDMARKAIEKAGGEEA